jgi:hypothetical protein
VSTYFTIRALLNIVAKNEHNLSPMKVFLNRCWLGLCMGGMMATGMGCASHSTEMARQLDKTNPEYRSAGCQQTLGEVWVHQDIKNVTTVATPAVALAAGPVFALPLLIAHVGLGAADRVDAATLAKRCGAPAPGVVDITTGVATDAALGVLGASAGAAVGKTLPAGAAAPLPAR